MSVDKFLFRVESLTHSNTGEAADWNWQYLQANSDAQRPDLRDTLRDQFRNRPQDINLLELIRSRTQKDREFFADFYQDIRRLVSRFQQPPKEAELVEALRPEIMRAIFPIYITTIRELRGWVEKMFKSSDSKCHFSELDAADTSAKDFNRIAMTSGKQR